MFESDQSHFCQDIFYTVNKVFKNKGEVALEIWAEHFSKPYKDRNKSLNRIFETDLMFMKRKYVFLESSQIMARTLSSFGIENVCGEISKTFLQKYKKRKRRPKWFERTTPSKNTRIRTKNTICKKTMKATENCRDIMTPRYPPVVERWSDTAFRKFKDITGRKDTTNYQPYTFSNDENQIKSKEVNKSLDSSKAEISTNISTEKLNIPDINKNQSDIVKAKTHLYKDKVESSHKQCLTKLETKVKNTKNQLHKLIDKNENNFKTNQSNITLQLAHSVGGHITGDKRRNSSENGNSSLNIEVTKLLDRISHRIDSNQISDNSESWSTKAVINEPNSKNSSVQKENLKKLNFKKSVRFNENLCSFAPTPQYFERSQEKTDVDHRNEVDKENCLGIYNVFNSNSDNKKIIVSECEHIFDELLRNATVSTNISNTENGPNSSKRDESSASTLRVLTNNSKSYKFTTMHDKTSCYLIKSQNYNGRITNKSEFEIEPYEERNLVVEETSHSSSISNTQTNSKDSQNLSCCTAKSNQNSNSNKMSFSDQQSETIYENKMDKQREEVQGIITIGCLDKMECKPTDGSQNSMSSVTCLRNEVVIEETSSSEEIGEKNLNCVFGITKNKQITTQIKQNKNINNTNKEDSYSFSKGNVSDKICPMKDPDEEYIPLSNSEDSNSQTECNIENKSEVILHETRKSEINKNKDLKILPQEDLDEDYIPLSNCEENSNSENESNKENLSELQPELRKSQINVDFMKRNISVQDVQQENNLVTQLLPKEENQNTSLMTPNKYVVSYIPRNLSPEGSLSDREYLSDDSVLSSQCDSREVSKVVSDKVITGKINKTLSILVQQEEQYNKYSVQANSIETKNGDESRRSSDNKKLTSKSFSKIERNDKKWGAQDVEMVLDKNKSVPDFESTTTPTPVVWAPNNKVSVYGAKTPEYSNISQEDISRRETVNIMMPHAPTKHNEVMINSDTLTKLDTLCTNWSKVANTKVCKSLFPIEILGENFSRSHDVIKPKTKEGNNNECLSPISVFIATASEKGNTSQVASFPTNEINICKYGIDPNAASPISNNYEKNNQCNDSENNLNNAFKPSLMLTVTRKLTNSQWFREKYEKSPTMREVGNINQNVGSSVSKNSCSIFTTNVQKDDRVNMTKSDCVKETLGDTYNNDLSSEEYFVVSPLPENRVNNTPESFNNNMVGGDVNQSRGNSSKMELEEKRDSQIRVNERILLSRLNDLMKIRGENTTLVLNLNQSSDTKVIENKSSSSVGSKRQLVLETNEDKVLVNSFGDGEKACARMPFQSGQINYFSLNTKNLKIWPQEDLDEEYMPLSNCEEESDTNSENDCDKDNLSELQPELRQSQINIDFMKQNICVQDVQHQNNLTSQLITKVENKNTGLETPRKNVASYIPQNLSPKGSLSNCEYLSDNCVLSSQCDSRDVRKAVSDTAISGKINQTLSISIQQEQQYNKPSVQASSIETKNIESRRSSDNKKLTSKSFIKIERNDKKWESQDVEMVLDKNKSIPDFTSSTKTTPVNCALNNKVSVDFKTPKYNNISQEDISRRETINLKIPHAPVKHNEVMINSDCLSKLDTPCTTWSKVANTKVCKSLFPIQILGKNFNPCHDVIKPKTIQSNNECLNRISELFDTTSEKENTSKVVSIPTNEINSCKNGMDTNASLITNNYEKSNQYNDSEINFNNNDFKPDFRLSVNKKLNNSQSLREKYEKSPNMRVVSEKVEFSTSKNCCKSTFTTNLQKDDCVIISKSDYVNETLENTFDNNLSSEEYFVVSPLPENRVKNTTKSIYNNVLDGDVDQLVDNTSKSKLEETRNNQTGVNNRTELNKCINFKQITGGESNESLHPIQSSQSKAGKNMIENNNSMITECKNQLAIHQNDNNFLITGNYSEDRDIVCATKPLQDPAGKDIYLGNKYLKMHHLSKKRENEHPKKSTDLEANSLFSVYDENLGIETKVGVLHSTPIFNSETTIQIQKQRVFPLKSNTLSKSSISDNIIQTESNRSLNLCATADIQSTSLTTDKGILNNSANENLKGSSSTVNIFKDTQSQANIYKTTISDSSNSKNSYSSSKHSKNIEVFIANNDATNGHTNKRGVLLKNYSESGSTSQTKKQNFKKFYSTQNKVHIHKKETEAKRKETNNRLRRSYDLGHTSSDKISNINILNSLKEISQTDTNVTVVTDTGDKIRMGFPTHNSDYKTNISKYSKPSSFKENHFNDSQPFSMGTELQTCRFSDQTRQSDNADSSVKILFGTSSPCKLELTKRHTSERKEEIDVPQKKNKVKINSEKSYPRGKENIPFHNNLLKANCNKREENCGNLITYLESNSPVKLQRAGKKDDSKNKNRKIISSYATTLKIPFSKQVRYASQNKAKLEVRDLKNKTGKRCNEGISSSAFVPTYSKPQNKTNLKASPSHTNELGMVCDQNKTFKQNSPNINRSNNELIDITSEEDTCVSSLKSGSNHQVNEITPSGDLSFVHFNENRNVNFDILKRFNEDGPAGKTRKRKHSSHEDVFYTDQKAKHKREKKTSDFPPVIDDIGSSPLLRSSDSENSSVYKSNSCFDNKIDLMSDEPDFEDDILNGHAGSQNDLSGSQSSDNIVRNFQMGSDLSSVKTDSEFPSMGSGFVPTSPNNWNGSNNDYLINMFHADDSSSLRSLSPGQEY